MKIKNFTITYLVVLNAVQMITPVENWFVKNLGSSKALALTHIFLEDTFRSRATQSVEAGNDYTALALTTPTRLQNVIEHVAVPFKVNYSEQFVEHYTGQNELERQTTKALSEWGEAAELVGQALGKLREIGKTLIEAIPREGFNTLVETMYEVPVMAKI